MRKLYDEGIEAAGSATRLLEIETLHGPTPDLAMELLHKGHIWMGIRLRLSFMSSLCCINFYQGNEDRQESCFNL